MNGDQNPATPPTGWQFNPGDTVTPAVPAQPTTPVVPAAQTPVQEAVLSPSVPAASVSPEPSAPIPPVGQPSADNFSDASMMTDELVAEGSDLDASLSSEVSGDQITWTASEYVAHHKTTMWYVVLVVVAVVAAGVAYLATKDLITAISIILIAFVFGLSAGRKPRVLEYSLDNRGLMVAQKTYAYGMFRSFAVIDEGAFASIVFIPLKRFMPTLAIYYAPEDEAQIVQILADHLPMEQRKRDAIDTLLHKIRF
jgi:hypothetical protein